MLRHVVLLKFKEDHSEAQVQAITDGMNTLADQIPEILAYTHGPDALGESTYDYAIVADFASEQDYRVYSDHPAHLAVGAHVVAILAEAAQMQFYC